jgi:hypothetical protein
MYLVNSEKVKKDLNNKNQERYFGVKNCRVLFKMQRIVKKPCNFLSKRARARHFPRSGQEVHDENENGIAVRLSR